MTEITLDVIHIGRCGADGGFLAGGHLDGVLPVIVAGDCDDDDDSGLAPEAVKD